MGQQGKGWGKNLMLGILLSLMPLVGWGISDFASSRMSKRLHPSAINLFFTLTGGIPVIIFCLFFGTPEISVRGLASFMAVSTLLTGGYLAMLKGFSSGATGVVSPIANAYAIITLAIAVLFLDVQAKPVQVLAIFIVVAGIALLSYKKSGLKKIGLHNSVLYAILALVLFGFGFAGFEVASTQEWYQNTILFQISIIIVAIAVSLVWLKKDIFVESSLVFKTKIGYVGAFFASSGMVGLFLALQHTDNVAVPAAIAAASPLVTVMLARHYDHEHLNTHQYVGAVVVVFGIVLLSQ